MDKKTFALICRKRRPFGWETLMYLEAQGFRVSLVTNTSGGEIRPRLTQAPPGVKHDDLHEALLLVSGHAEQIHEAIQERTELYRKAGWGEEVDERWTTRRRRRRN